MKRSQPIRLALAGLVVALIGVTVLLVVGVPYPVAELAPERSAPLIVLDREGGVLRSIPATGGHRRHPWVPLGRMSPHVALTLIASEDQAFYEHAGVDPAAIGKAIARNLEAGGMEYGASTLTMQLMRMVHSPGRERTLWNKLRETVWALRLERAVGKNQILEQYLNRAYFGNGAWGIEAAARTYFAKSADALSVGEAAYLMVVPRGPSYYNPLKHHDRVLQRRNHLFGLLVRQGKLTEEEAARAQAYPVVPKRFRPDNTAPHFVEWVVGTLPPDLGKGGTVTTSLDPVLQKALAHRTREHVASMRSKGVQQAGVVVLDSKTGEVLAMVGSAGSDTPGGHVNIATRRRYPGSALKPFVYATAIERGESPASVAYDILDVPSEYRVDGRWPTEHGPARYREALAGSYNLAAVHVLEEVGVERVAEKLRSAGVSPLLRPPSEYGLRLALGSTKVRLVDLAAGYGFLVRGGSVVAPSGVAGVEFATGGSWAPSPPLEQRVFSPQVSWLVADMLSDPEARRKVFGHELPADLPYPVAVKTGTARGFSDVFAVFATAEYTVAAWAGRFDGKPTKGVHGMDGAGPLARAGLQLASKGRTLTLPSKPNEIDSVKVCPISGKAAGPHCPHGKQEYFIRGTVPKEPCDWHRVVSGQVVVDYPAEVKSWERRHRRL